MDFGDEMEDEAPLDAFGMTSVRFLPPLAFSMSRTLTDIFKTWNC
jgi:hypothetical protein